ncbi:Protein CBG27707 [Caenorhabditis briggsae]|uniref:Protein CBG27707 n=1 Tax=Caenorhabditis briggsae TaxID=6238 RepID=B6IJF2_CAEBR|nr:Protein CBG27707 [Caenorhabditis briggsae]CAR99986.1 Protein CBG27707 [Caenorhabditis briggsae]
MCVCGFRILVKIEQPKKKKPKNLVEPRRKWNEKIIKTRKK